jgi:hypothetical protein
MTEFTLGVARAAVAPGLRFRILHAGGERDELVRWLGGDLD